MKTRGFLPRGRWTRGRNRFLTSGVTRASSPHGGPLVSIPGRVKDVVNLDVAVVLDILDLLPVPVGLLEGLDDQGSGGGADSNLIKMFFKIFSFPRTNIFTPEPVCSEQ